MGARNLGFERVQVDFYNLVKELGRFALDLRVGDQQMFVLLGHVHQPRPPCGSEVRRHPVVIGVDVAGRAQFSSHVGSGGLAGAADGLGPRAEIFDDGVGASGYRENAGQVDDDVFGSGPTL